MLNKTRDMEKIKQEIWKDIPEYEGLYQVSNIGNIRSLDRKEKFGKATRNRAGRDIKPLIQASGYVKADIRKGKTQGAKFIHRLVALAFIPNPDNLPCVCHKNDIKDDNRVENLFWGSYKENSLDMVSKNRQSKGSDRPASKLKEEDIPKIWGMLKEGIHSTDKIGNIFNVSRAAITSIKRGSTWSHVTSKLSPLSKPKLSPKGNIVLSFEKELPHCYCDKDPFECKCVKMYSREEVEKLIIQFAEDCGDDEDLICYEGEIDGVRQYNDAKKWIKDNLK